MNNTLGNKTIDLIDQLNNKIDTSIDGLDVKVGELKANMSIMEQNFNTEIDVLNTNLTQLEDKVDIGFAEISANFAKYFPNGTNTTCKKSKFTYQIFAIITKYIYTISQSSF